MSTKREPLLSDVQMKEMQRLSYTSSGAELANDVRNLYEAARAKDAELIQRLVDEIMKNANGYGQEWEDVLNAAAAAGYKPSEQ